MTLFAVDAASATTLSALDAALIKTLSTVVAAMTLMPLRSQPRLLWLPP